MYLKEIRLYSDQDVSKCSFLETFHIQAEAITDLFSSYLNKIYTDKVRIVNINCVSEKNFEKPILISPFLDVCILYDVGTFNELGDEEKEKELVNLILRGMKVASEILDLDDALFMDIAKRISFLDYKNRFIWKKPKFSPDKKLKAYVRVEWGLQKVKVEIVIEDKKKNCILEEDVELKHPGRMGLDVLGELVWIDSKTVELRHQYIKDEVYQFSIKSV
ncbi:hypothetical protein HCI99_04950 [Listeria booriae]|uniref:Uncharacterized protein n=1 Tax=Listeria booriae TaxID=1552123 RepID=A0A7X0XBP3_9LIST|nr:hypothetical protein [Listeria booriae]MBC1491167.1 hypothetical protein [Listeria booriae]